MFIFVIKKIRTKRGITLYRLSKLTGISRSYLIELENNKKFNPSLSTMDKIAHALNVKVDDLFYSELDMENLKMEMYKKIDEFGLNSPEVLEISQVIDLLINLKFKK